MSNGPWSPLRIAVYRSIWLAGVVSNIGTFMHLAAAGWAMTLLTDSPTLIGLVQTAWAIPGFILALHSGAFADLVDRRRLILTTELAAVAVAAGLAVLQWTGAMNVPLLLVGTLLESVVLTLSAPAFMALTPHLVGPDRAAQALGLDAISRNLATALGPALAGLVMLVEGPGAVFMLNAVSFAGVVVVVQRRRAGWGEGRPEGNVNSAIVAGLREIGRNRGLHRPIIRVSFSVFAAASIAALLPALAANELGLGSRGYGLLGACQGIGSVIAVWTLPRLRAARRPERSTALSGIVWTLGAVLVASAPRVWLAAVGVVLCGTGWMGVINTLYSNYMVELPAWMKGRGASMVMLTVWLGTSAGAVVWGAVASATDVRTALWWAAASNMAIVAVSPLVLRVHAPALVGGDAGSPVAASAAD
ncbi:MAG: MFS transporter [Ilumatobacteraceae bacterium]